MRYPKCAVTNCQFLLRKIDDDRDVFYFPIDKIDLNRQWTEATGKINWKPSAKSFICDNHFSSSCFEVINGKKHLVDDALPTLHLSTSSSSSSSASLKTIESNSEEKLLKKKVKKIREIREVIGSWQYSEWKCQQCLSTFAVSGLLAHHLPRCLGLNCGYTPSSGVQINCIYCYRQHQNDLSLSSLEEVLPVGGGGDGDVKTFKTLSELDEHLLNCPNKTDDEIYHCQLCGQQFSSVVEMIQHQLVYHEVYSISASLLLPKRSFHCGACSKSFSSNKKLSNHLMESCACQGIVNLTPITSIKTDGNEPEQQQQQEWCSLLEKNFDIEKQFETKFPYSRMGLELITYGDVVQTIEEEVESVVELTIEESKLSQQPKAKRMKMSSVTSAISSRKNITNKKYTTDVYDISGIDDDDAADASTIILNEKKKKSSSAATTAMVKQTSRTNGTAATVGQGGGESSEGKPVKESLQDRLKRIRLNKKLLRETMPSMPLPSGKTAAVHHPTAAKKPRLSSTIAATKTPVTTTTTTTSTTTIKEKEKKVTKSDKMEKSTFDDGPAVNLSCPSCGDVFSTLALRDKHFRVEHPGLKVFACQICGSTFETYLAFNNHITRYHPQEECEAMYGVSPDDDNADADMDYVCDKCSLAFVFSDVLTKHQALEHKNDEVVKRRRGRPPSIKKATSTFSSFSLTSAAAASSSIIGGASSLPTATIQPSPASQAIVSSSSLIVVPSSITSSTTTSTTTITKPSSSPRIDVPESSWMRLWMAFMGLKKEDLTKTGEIPSSTAAPVCCSQCKQVLHNQLEFHIHWRREHLFDDESQQQLQQQDSSMACQFCYQLFIGPRALADIKEHLTKAHANAANVVDLDEDENLNDNETAIVAPYSCRNCNACFERQQQWQWHTTGFNEQRENKCPALPKLQYLTTALFVCPNCSIVFAGDDCAQRAKSHASQCFPVNNLLVTSHKAVKVNIDATNEVQEEIIGKENYASAAAGVVVMDNNNVAVVVTTVAAAPPVDNSIGNSLMETVSNETTTTTTTTPPQPIGIATTTTSTATIQPIQKEEDAFFEFGSIFKKSRQDFAASSNGVNRESHVSSWSGLPPAPL